jgi:ATP-dependent Clp protease ATP-binding subunit ClpB|tara:strand:- start:1994 stop:4519 length:2526 start_codon:yes stop_codon:yes gene_type:complete
MNQAPNTASLKRWTTDGTTNAPSSRHLNNGVNQRINQTAVQIKTDVLSETTGVSDASKDSDSAVNPEEELTALERFCTDVTEEAKQGVLDPLIGRDEELRRLIHVLCRRTKNNPVLLGQPGVGKTAIVEGLAQRIVSGDVPAPLRGARLLELDLGAVGAGCQMPGEFEERLSIVVSEIVEASQKGTIVLFIDDIHNLCPPPPAGNNGAAILKPALGRGLLKCVGASTVEKFKKTIEQDAALERRFQQVPVGEPDTLQTISVLRGLRARYEMHHSIKISESAIVAAAKLSSRYIQGRCLPDKAIDLLDEAAAAVRMQKTLKPEDLDVVERRLAQLTREHGQVSAKLAEEKYKPGTGGKITAACLLELKEKIVSERTKQNKLFAEFEKEQKATREHKRAAAELSFAERRLENARSKQIQAGQNMKDVADALAKAKTMGDEAAIVTAAAEVTRATRDVNLTAEEESELAELVSKAKSEYIKAEDEIVNMSKGQGLMSKEEVTDIDVASVVSRWTGVPVAKLVASEKAKLLQLEAELHQRVVGQEHAVTSVAEAVQRSRADLSDPNGPVASFMFLGPTGVGKTELAKALASYLFNSDTALIRLDMSEYMEKHSVARLIGAPPGYIGYDEGGMLTDAVRQKPYSIVLFDEIEKAHVDVFNVLLQLLDEGHVTDTQGRTVSFRNCLIIMTSNLGSDEIAFGDRGRRGRRGPAHIKDRVMSHVRAHFRPEFINRLDEFIVFDPLTHSQIMEIVQLQCNKLIDRVAGQRMKLELEASAIDYLASKGFDPVYGARPVKRAIQSELIQSMANHILRGVFEEDDTIVVSADKNGLALTSGPKIIRDRPDVET